MSKIKRTSTRQSRVLIAAIVVFAAHKVFASWNDLVDSGWALHDTGNYIEAEKRGVDALHLVRSESPVDQVALTATLYLLGAIYSAEARYEEARASYADALEAMRRIPSHKKVQEAAIGSHVVEMSSLVGRYAEAESLGCELVTMITAEFGSSHESTGMCLFALAGVYFDQRKYSDAYPLYEQALKILEAAKSDNLVYLLSVQNNLARVCVELGDYARADSLAGEALSGYRRVLGERHVYASAALNCLAISYLAQGRVEEASKAIDEALEIAEEGLGTNHPNTATVAVTAAEAYFYVKDYEQSLKFYNRAIAIRISKLGERHPHIAECLSGMALVYEAQGDSLAARAVRDEARRMVGGSGGG